MSGRLDTVQRWIGGGRTICPFAALAHRRRALRYVRLPAERRSAAIWRELRAFIAQKEDGIVFVLLPPDPPDWAAGQRAVSVLFEEIVVGMTRLTYPRRSVEAIQRDIAAQLRLADATGRRLLPTWGGIPGASRGHLFVIGMGPQYPADHPRYAPCTLVQCTWQADVTAARFDHPALQRRIDAAMVASVGGVYDADELWLPVRPEVAARRPALEEEERRALGGLGCLRADGASQGAGT